MKKLAWLFMILAGVGLALSVYVHAAALLDLPLPDYSMGLHVGIFVVWLPAILVASSTTKGTPRKDFWKVALRGCPGWMRYALYAVAAYAFISFAAFAYQGNSYPNNNVPPSLVVRGFSGHWLAFYGAAFAILY